MADLLLHQRFRTEDAAAASAAVQAVFGVGTVTAVGGPLEYVQQSLVDDGISATRIASSGTAVQVQAAATPDLVVVSVREGSVEVRQDDGAVVLGQGELGVIAMGTAVELRWDRVTMDAFSFPPSSVQRLLGSEGAVMRLRCARLMPRSPALVALWQRTAGVLVAEVLQKRELYGSDIIREQAITALLAVAIEAFGISDVAEDETDAGNGDPRRHAEAFMQAHLSDQITMPDVARAAGVSLRGLQLAFQRAGEGTPLLHLRQLRMVAAKAALEVGGDDRALTVGAVARRFSYSNLGRFSAHYREACGESPIETLRSARAAASA